MPICPGYGPMQSSSGNSPVIALTSGDPGGIGLELAARAWKELGPASPIVLIADRKHYSSLNLHPPAIEVTDPECAPEYMSDGMPLYHVEFGKPARAGTSDPGHYRSIIRSIDIAVEWALAGRVAGLCTNPAPKSTFMNERHSPSGHTEWLARRCRSSTPLMMMVNSQVRTVTATTHVPLHTVPAMLTREHLKRVILGSRDGLRSLFGISRPLVGVTGLNPHAGEDGLLGHEEIDTIIPVIRELQAEGLDLEGPLPADSAFGPRLHGKFDAVICMYHDQALIPVKTLDRDDTVNVTLGLPIVRTSPGHGTALELAGTGNAHPGSLVAAIRLAGILGMNNCKDSTREATPATAS